MLHFEQSSTGCDGEMKALDRSLTCSRQPVCVLDVYVYWLQCKGVCIPTPFCHILRLFVISLVPPYKSQCLYICWGDSPAQALKSVAWQSFNASSDHCAFCYPTAESAQLSIHMSLYPSIHLSICLSVCLSVYISIYISVCPCVYLSIQVNTYRRQ